MKVLREQARVEWFLVGAALLLLFATSFANPLFVVGVSAVLLIAATVFIPHLRQRGLIAAAIALAVALALARIAQSL